MEYKRFGNEIVLRLDPGDEIYDKLRELAEKENIKMAGVRGIGGTKDIDLGVYDVELGTYRPHHYDEVHEITSIIGTINTMNGEFYSHLHLTIAAKDGHVYGGHLLRCVITFTSEIIVSVIDGTVDREYNAAAGCNTFKFS